MKKILLLPVIVLPLSVFSQDLLDNNQASKLLFQNECNGMVFTKIETLPSFKISKSAFEDSLTWFLKDRKAYVNSRILLSFIVTKNGKIFNIKKLVGEGIRDQVLEESLQKFSDMWLPAKQNGNTACSYVKLWIEIKRKKLQVSVM